MARTAQCGCGRLRITVEGDPLLVGACHCDFCQKRTGSVVGVQAYFSENQCREPAGDSNVYNGLEVDGVGSAAGHSIDYHFCSTCGSTVFWKVKGQPGAALIGIAVGNFVDPRFPPPQREYYMTLCHEWLPPIAGAMPFETFPDEDSGLAL